MKTAVSSRRAILAGTIGTCGLGAALMNCQAEASSITYSGASLTVAAVPTATIGSQGYVFYDPTTTDSEVTQNVYTGVSATSPVSYVSISPVGGPFGGYNYGGSPLTIAGTSYQTGVSYTGNSAEKTLAATAHTIATITLTQSGVNGDSTAGALVSPFTLGLLEDNFGDSSSNNMAAAGLQLTGGSASPGDTGSASTPLNGDDPPSSDFYQFTVSGAHVGDTISVLVTPGYYQGEQVGNLVIGGLTFDSAVPEPTAIVGLVSATGLALLRRRRSRIA
jgi:hypothetical protein